MALPNVGVQLVAEDATGFSKILQGAQSAVDGFAKSAGAAASSGIATLGKASTSAVSSVSGLGAAVKSVEKIFGGLASAAGSALSPLVSIFDRVFNVILRQLIRQVVREIEQFIGSMAQAAIAGTELETDMGRLDVSLKAVAKTSFKPLVDELGGLVTKAAPAFLGIVQAAETYLGSLGQNALAWGSNVVTQFAQGMWNAIGSVLSALTDIANMITYWLSPGSPPKLLPDLDTWGTDAANEFLAGWGKADFSVFNELSSTLTSLIRSMPIPKGEQAGVVPQILGAREGIARAVEELRTAGSVTKATMDAIIASVGTASASVRAYLVASIKLQAANLAVKDAQAELNAVTKVYNDLLKPVDEQLAGITESQQQLADEQKKGMLALVLLDPGATPAEKRNAQLEIERINLEKNRRALLAEQKVAVDGATDKLDAARLAQSAAQEEFDRRKEAIALETEQNNLLKEQLRLLESLAKPPGGGAGGPPKPLAFGVKKFNWDDFIPKGIQEKWEAFTNALAMAWDKFLDVMQPAIDAWNNDVVPAWNHLVDVIVSSIPDIKNAIAQMVAFVAIEMGVVLPAIFKNAGLSLGSLATVWDHHHKTILGIVVFAWKAVVATIAGTMVIISGVIAFTMATISGALDFWSAIINGNWSGAWTVMKQTVAEILGIITDTIRGTLDAALAMVNLKTSDITTVWSKAFDAFLLVVDIVLPRVKFLFIEAMQNLANAVISGPLTAINNLFNAAKEFWAWLTGHPINSGSGGFSTSGSSSGAGGTSSPLASPQQSASTVSTNNVTGPSFTYAPTYGGNAPSVGQSFATMQALYG